MLYSYDSNIKASADANSLYNKFEKYTFTITATSPRDPNKMNRKPR